MSIPGIQNINVGLPNESANSDSLYTAFEKTRDNFTNLFACSSPYNTFTAGAGVTVNANATVGSVTITNTGVTSIIAGTNIVINQSNGNVTISTTGSGNGGGLSSIGLNPASTSRLVVTNTPLVTNGNMTIDLATSGVTQGTYNNPTLTVDNYGRIVSAANGNIAGTVTSIGLVSGPGIQVNGGPITSNGNITVTNIGVTRINAGSGIVVSGGNGNVTISAASLGGTVTSVGVSSSQLVVTGSPVVSSGTINVELPANATFTGTVTSSREILSGSEDLAASAAANLLLDTSYFTTTTSETATLAAGTNGQVKKFVMFGDGGDMVITVTNAGWKSSGTGTMTFSTIGQACTLQYINNKWFCIGNNGATFA
jgi:fibronectin-binding autotransporter adhesin